MIAAIALFAAAVSETAIPFRRPVPDAELAMMRGGIRLPNGLDISIGIDIQTRINGVLALHTIYSSETPNAGIRIYTDGRGGAAVAPGSTAVTVGAGAQAPVIDAARASSGTTVLPGVSGQPTTVNILTGTSSTWPDATGQTPVAAIANGAPVASEAGTIALVEDSSGARVTLNAPGVVVTQLVGQATGVVVANTANNRTIDTTSSINVNLAGVPAALLGGTLMINRVAAEAASRR